jgi:hypothetical protein
MAARITAERGEPDPAASADEDNWEDAEQDDYGDDHTESGGTDSPFSW